MVKINKFENKHYFLFINLVSLARSLSNRESRVRMSACSVCLECEFLMLSVWRSQSQRPIRLESVGKTYHGLTHGLRVNLGRQTLYDLPIVLLARYHKSFITEPCSD